MLLKWLKITPKPPLRGKSVWSARQGLQGEELSVTMAGERDKLRAHDPQEQHILGEVLHLVAG